MAENGTMLEARGRTRVYRRGSEDIRAVDGVSLRIRRGEFVSFMRPSATSVMVSHNPELARLGERLVEMRDGRAYET